LTSNLAGSPQSQSSGFGSRGGIPASIMRRMSARSRLA
jgi:hypothetical protein